MNHRRFHRAVLVLLAMLGFSCLQEPSGPAGSVETVEFMFDESGTVAAELAALLEKARSAGTEHVSVTAKNALRKTFSPEAINEARVLVLDCTKWSSEASLLLALAKEPDSLYSLAGLDVRKDVWDNLLALFKAYKGKIYSFAGEYVLTIQGGYARGIVSVRPGLNIFFAVLRDERQTVYVYSTLVRIAPAQNTTVSLAQTAVVKTLLSNIAVWDSSGWSPLGTGVNGEVNAIASSGSQVYVGGAFSRAGGIAASNVAVWNDQAQTWSALGSGLNGPVTDLLVVGSDVYATGAFTSSGPTVLNNVARWNGSTWSALGNGVNAQANAVAVFGSSILVGGEFSSASGSAANNIAEWNGSSWAALNSGTNGSVYSLVSTPSAVIVGGNFGRAGPLVGGVQANNIAAWNGAWSGLSTGTNTLGSVRALAVGGNLLFAGGLFSLMGGTSANNVAVWTGSAWQPLAGGFNGRVQAIEFDSADSSLYVGGASLDLTSTISGPTSTIARYKSGTWVPLGKGLDGPVSALKVNAQRLFVGGSFKYNN